MHRGSLSVRLLTALWLTVSTVGTSAFAGPGKGNGPGSGDGDDAGNQPYLAFAAQPTEVSPGETARLSWASSSARFCVASGDWDGRLNTEGSYVTAPLTSDGTFTLTCKSGGNTAEATVSVAVSAPEPSPEPTPEPEPAPAPAVSLTAADLQVPNGGSTVLNWSASDATACIASGGWNGEFDTSGSRTVGPLNAGTTFRLSCTGDGGTASAAATIDIAAQPTLAFRAVDALVQTGTSTELRWSSTDATSCLAGGGWSGSQATSGASTVGPINGATTFSLNCSGIGGSTMKLISVSVHGEVVLTWRAPTENVDGSDLTDLAGYRIYYGSMSGQYTDQLGIDNGAATQADIPLPSGRYYFAMTALDQHGGESAFSNEVYKIID